MHQTIPGQRAALLLMSIFGKRIRPFTGLLLLYGLRQTGEALGALPPPKGMIWRDPGFASFLVDCDVMNDFFFPATPR